ncbi:hypothetical protein BpKM390_26640 [Burkholderia pseudomallei]|nr:hypothetical protein GTC019_25630 [Burkholderia pseudomallei]BEH25400.1 hypothetical protein GTC050_26520 [Burkholderia pseudomallei]BEH31417.1 hypothetical protein GTC054_26330 [Burkholderia pseudomallei]BEH37434.1 hypothetical protein GTC254T_25290 [Burkholderia pseudomallei]BEH43388.1 hypothetical protein KNG_25890 [Burkholderia pseudomallei]
MPLPFQSSISAAAWRSTSSGIAAGPAEKLKTRIVKNLGRDPAASNRPNAAREKEMAACAVAQTAIIALS